MRHDISLVARRQGKRYAMEQLMAELLATGREVLIVHADGRLERRKPDGTITFEPADRKLWGRSATIFDPDLWHRLPPHG